MYSNLYRLCQYNSHLPPVITSNRHFLNPGNPIYCPSNIISSRINFAPKSWGSAAWDFLFAMADGYSKHPTYSEKLQMRRFLESLQSTLPCEKCRDNYSVEILNLTDANLSNNKTVRAWLENLRVLIRKKKEDDSN